MPMKLMIKQESDHKLKYIPDMVYIVYQNNISTMKLKVNGKASSGKSTRHFDIEFSTLQI